MRLCTYSGHIVEKQFKNTKRKAHEAGADVRHFMKAKENNLYSLQARKSSGFTIAEILLCSSKNEVLSGENTFLSKQPR